MTRKWILDKILTLKIICVTCDHAKISKNLIFIMRNILYRWEMISPYYYIHLLNCDTYDWRLSDRLKMLRVCCWTWLLSWALRTGWEQPGGATLCSLRHIFPRNGHSHGRACKIYVSRKDTAFMCKQNSSLWHGSFTCSLSSYPWQWCIEYNIML